MAVHGYRRSWLKANASAFLGQIKLLKILSLLGAGDKAASDNMYAVIGDAMRRANSGHTIGNAIVYEAVCTITAIYPNPTLLQSGALSRWPGAWCSTNTPPSSARLA